MSKRPTHSFHTRLPVDLKEALDESRGKTSLNREIVARLRRTVTKDDAETLADQLRPLLAGMSEDDRAEFVRHAGLALRILARGRRTRSRR